MQGRTPTKEEKEWMNQASQLGCIVCRLYVETISPCSIHHTDGKVKPGAHLKTIGLCGRHHQIPDNEKPKRWISRHGDGKKAFEREYKTETELIEITRGLIECQSIISY